MSSELLASIGGVLLSVIAAYLPGFSRWYAAQSTEYKRLVMAGALLLVAAGAFGLACARLPIPGLAVTCDLPGVFGLVQAFIAALIANQATYQLAVRHVRAARAS